MSKQVRRWLMWGALGLVLFLVSTGLVWDDAVPAVELDLFEWINGWPDALAVPLWPFMQFGMVVAPFIAAGFAFYRRRKRDPALGLALGGFTMWLLAKVVKEVVGRPRPGGLLEEVNYRVDGGPDGLGFVSGHAVVGFLIVVVAAPYLSRKWTIVLLFLALLAGTLRVYVGAHLPLDIVGGAGLGIAAGALINLVTVRD
ncbi:MAG: phosphatase PAP2 family protein [Acidimicrobiia bacterium]|jgi:undecaprenyl-diphosphatase